MINVDWVYCPIIHPLIYTVPGLIFIRVSNFITSVLDVSIIKIMRAIARDMNSIITVPSIPIATSWIIATG